MQRVAFSLVELSIVLVILGLLVGGILAGQSLIRASELRAVGAEIARYQTAMHGFRDKYFALPGDFNNATAFWGKDNAACPGNSGTASATGTCNGNGDGMIMSAGAASSTGEANQTWKHLALAGLIEGNYSGLSGSNSATDATPLGVTVPASKLQPGGYSFNYYNPTGGDANHYVMNYGNHLIFGKALINFNTLGAMLKPEEVWNIDSKIDDGMPGTGKLILTYWTSCSTSASMTDFTGEYRLNVTAATCAFRYRNFI